MDVDGVPMDVDQENRMDIDQTDLSLDVSSFSFCRETKPYKAVPNPGVHPIYQTMILDRFMVQFEAFVEQARREHLHSLFLLTQCNKNVREQLGCLANSLQTLPVSILSRNLSNMSGADHTQLLQTANLIYFVYSHPTRPYGGAFEIYTYDDTLNYLIRYSSTFASL
ncbi:hypothetical protein E1B28_006905 [Marasmius oreades]|uniref:Uncharacterized protein n=2 Tax=Marasmius oreades TaxID=181124 RepID=A0A9P7S0J1_9AGAR|nr:uncharacterized protein E1B28_006905 [Marasmius oreades]KAG7093219.1 hypothetical protein E1B28_006905 [Marasmius oreades]